MSVKETDIHDAALVVEERIQFWMAELDWNQLLKFGRNVLGALDPDVVKLEETINNWDGDF
jgi:hypothetical protein